jgi:hypothetical protein
LRRAEDPTFGAGDAHQAVVYSLRTLAQRIIALKAEGLLAPRPHP